MQQFNIHFEGFYNSIHDQEIDSMLESYFSDEQGMPLELPDNIDYQKIFLAYSQLYLKAFNQFLNEEYALDVKLAFKELDSPREYNFATDVIISEVSDSDFNLLKTKFLIDPEFVEYVNEASKSYDGFVSFYTGIEEVAADDEIFLSYVSKYIIGNGRDEINDLLSDGYYSYEMLYSIDFQTN